MRYCNQDVLFFNAGRQHSSEKRKSFTNATLQSCTEIQLFKQHNALQPRGRKIITPKDIIIHPLKQTV